jgi:hypothetical protein
MSDNSSRESAERFVFSNNAAQNNLFTSCKVYYIPVLTLVVAGLEFFVAFGDQDYVVEVLAFIQTFFGLGGLFFAIWAHETKAKRIENTYLLMTGMLVQVAVLVIGLANFAGFLLSSQIPTPFYFLPALGYLVGFFISYIVAKKQANHFQGTTARTTSFGGVIVLTVIGILAAWLITSSTEEFVQSLEIGRAHV